MIDGLPESRDTFLQSSGNILPVRTFLESYYRKYDSEDRASLINNYHVNALFSIKFNKIPAYEPPDAERYVLISLLPYNFNMSAENPNKSLLELRYFYKTF